MVNIHASNPMEYHIWMALNSKWLLIIPLINSAIFQWYKIFYENSNSFRQANPFLCFSTNKVYHVCQLLWEHFFNWWFHHKYIPEKITGWLWFLLLETFKTHVLLKIKKWYIYNIFIIFLQRIISSKLLLVVIIRAKK